MSIIKANTFFRQQSFDGPIIVLDNLLTPDNIGSTLRLAGNIGCKKVILTQQLNNHLQLSQNKIQKIARNSLQYLELLFLTYEEIVRQFDNLVAIETSSHAKNIYKSKLPLSSTFVVGNEKYGISTELLKHCKQQVYIPMPGNVKSLNVSHALSIALFEWYRQNFEL